jgi:hypothetical protein
MPESENTPGPDEAVTSTAPLPPVADAAPPVETAPPAAPAGEQAPAPGAPAHDEHGYHATESGIAAMVIGALLFGALAFGAGWLARSFVLRAQIQRAGFTMMRGYAAPGSGNGNGAQGYGWGGRRGMMGRRGGMVYPYGHGYGNGTNPNTPATPPVQ